MAGCGPGCACSQKRYEASKSGKVARDPVCGQKVNCDSPDSRKLVREGVEHHFCSTKCMADFVNDPERYLNRKRGFFGFLKV